MNSNIYNIVIADDDNDDQFFLKEAIGKIDKSPNLISVFNGAELLDLLYHRGNYSSTLDCKPDLVLLDLNMPVMDGFNALAQIKKDAGLKDIPVYIFTTSKRENDRKVCELLGADDFYSKPSEFAKLQAVVELILGKAFKIKAKA
jgi:CheY-like chemotaxis protein